MIDWNKPIETVPCKRNPKPVPCKRVSDKKRRVIFQGSWIDYDGSEQTGKEWGCFEDGEFYVLDGSIRNVQQDQQPELDPTATWWAKRWWQSATDAEKDAMRVLVGSE